MLKLRYPYFLRNVIIVCPRYNGILVEDVVDKLRRDPDFDFTAFHSLRSRIYKLSWLALFLAVLSRLCEQKMLQTIRYGYSIT